MVISVLNLIKRHLGKVTLASGLLFSTFANAQPPGQGGAIAGYAYLGSCMVNGQPHYYYASRTEATWPVANAAATALVGGTGHLATLTSLAENNCVFTLYANYLTNGVPAYPIPLGRPTFGNSYGDPRNAWIGFNDASAENTFTWANGENCNTFTNWDYGNLNSPADGDMSEPNNQFTPGNSNGEDYVQLLAFLPAPGEPTIITPPSLLPGDAAPGGLGRKHAGFWNDWFNTESQYYIVEFGPNTCVGDEGCSLGYWKNHEEDWEGFTTGQTLEAVFNIPDGLGLDMTTLMQALSFGGGKGVQGASQNLLRQAVAALLNASSSGVDYPLSVIQVVAQVNAALATNDRDQILAFASTLDGYNNLHGATLCPGEIPTTTARRVSPATSSVDQSFAVSGYPNPSRSSFSIQINGLASENVSVKVTDATGRLVEQRTNVPANQTLQVGNTYKPGMYYVEVLQGTAKKQLKMIKQ